MEKIPITPKGHSALEAELKLLKSEERPAIIRAIAEAREHGDLSENAEYHAAREKQSLILYKKQLMQSHSPFQIIEDVDVDTKEVGFGNKVLILEDGKDKAEDYYILGPIELDLDLYPLVVTYHSPFGQALIGKKVNEDFTLDIRGKEIKFTVTAIEKISSE